MVRCSMTIEAILFCAMRKEEDSKRAVSLANPCKPLSPLHLPYIQAGLFVVYFGLANSMLIRSVLSIIQCVWWHTV
jgi:hypothetical protein